MTKNYHWLICILFAFASNQAKSKDPLFQTAQSYHENISYRKSIAQPRTKKDSLFQAVQEYHKNLNGPKIPSQIRINYSPDMFSEYIKEATGGIIPTSKDIAERIDPKNKKTLFIIKKLQYILPETCNNYDFGDFTGYVAFWMMLDDEKLEFDAERYIETYPLVAFNFMDESRLDEIFDAESFIELLENLSKYIRKPSGAPEWSSDLLIHAPLITWDSWHTELTTPFPNHEWPHYPCAKFIGGGIGKLAYSIFHQNDYINRSKQLARIIAFFSCYESDFPCTKSSIDFWGYDFDKDVVMMEVETGRRKEGDMPLMHEHSADHTFLTILFKKINGKNPELAKEVLNSVSRSYATSYHHLCRKWLENNSSFPDRETVQLVKKALETQFDHLERLYKFSQP